MRAATLSLILVVAGCSASTKSGARSSSATPAGSPAASPPAEAEGKLGKILAGSRLVSPQADAIVVVSEELDRACKRAHYPMKLDAERAADLKEYTVGSVVDVVHAKGVAQRKVTEVRCDAAGPVELGLSEPMPGSEAARGLLTGELVASFDEHPDEGARLARPEPLESPSTTVRAAFGDAISAQAQQIANGCPTATRPPLASRTQIETVIETTNLYAVRAQGRKYTFGAFGGIVAGCGGERRTVAFLLHPGGRVVGSWIHAAVALAWVTDLDGDGNQELAVHASERGFDEGEDPTATLRLAFFAGGDGPWGEHMLHPRGE